MQHWRSAIPGRGKTRDQSVRLPVRKCIRRNAVSGGGPCRFAFRALKIQLNNRAIEVQYRAASTEEGGLDMIGRKLHARRG